MIKFKKPKFWDLKKPSIISYFLLPLTLPVFINNLILNFKSSKKNKKIKSICIGNIYLGGTGKTPTVIKLFEILNNLNLKVSTGKKSYSSQLDEKIILQKKTNLIEAKNRKMILNEAIKNHQNIIIFDDGLQDKGVSYDLQFVCFDMNNFIGNGQLLPSGPLREKISSLIKYDAVFLKGENDKLTNHIDLIKSQNENIKIFETYLEIDNINKFNPSDNYLIFSGIGNPNSFKNLLKKNNFNIIKEIIFPDHYDYTKHEIEKLKIQAKNINAKIITTEKDFVKIAELDSGNIDFVEVKLKIKNEENLINFLKTKMYE